MARSRMTMAYIRKTLLAALLVAICAGAPHVARAYTLPGAGNPIAVAGVTPTNPTNYHYSTTKMNPNNVPSSWSLVYDPNPKWSVIAIENAMIPGTQDEFLFVYKSNPARLGYRDYAAAVFDVSKASKAGNLGDDGSAKGVQHNVSVASNPWCGHLTQMHDGRILVVGGSDATPNGHTNGLKDVRIFDYKNNPRNLPTVAKCRDGRWYPSVTLLQDNRLMIQGGTVLVGETVPASNWLERWDPGMPKQSPIPSFPIDGGFVRAVGKNYFPMQSLLPTGDLFIMNDDKIRFLTFGGTYRDVKNVPAFPDKSVANQWPRSGTMVLGAMTAADGYTTTEIIILGGTPKSNTCSYGTPDNRVLAKRTIWRLRIKMGFTNADGTGTPTYSFPDGKWLTDDMGIPRTGGDGVLTPAGDVVLVSGSQRGCHGGQGKNFYADGSGRYTIEPRNSAPAFWPILFQPNNPANKRVTILAASKIARVYHHSAALTLDGHILVAGCDECNASQFFRDGVDNNMKTFWSPVPVQQGKREHRIELLKTPFSLDGNNRPQITSIKVGGGAANTDRLSEVDATYGQTLTITWKSAKGLALPTVDGVSLVAPSASTHTYNNNQRVLKLQILSNNKQGNTGTLTVKLPPNSRVAPRQFYMLYLLAKKTNSRAWWVRVK